MIPAAQRRQAAHAVLDEVAQSVQSLETPVAQKILRPLRMAQDEITKELRDWLSTEDLQKRWTTQRWRNALVSIQRARGFLGDLEDATASALEAGAARASTVAISNLEFEWMKFSRIFSDSIQPIALDTAAVIVKGDNLLLDRFPSSAAKYAGSVRDTVVNELAVSRIKGETLFELTGRLEKRLPSVFQGQRYDAHRLARTETLNAYNTYHDIGIQELTREDPGIVSRWDSTLDSRRCPICRSLDGQTANTAKREKFVAEWRATSKAKGTRLKRLEVVHPPAHPQCRCVVVPWHKSWAEYPRYQALAS